MGTSGLITVYHEGEPVATLLAHAEGYPDTLGRRIKDALEDVCIGDPCGDGTPFKDMASLAAYLVGALKGESYGDIYMLSSGSTVHRGYEYKLWAQNGAVYLEVTNLGWVSYGLYHGPLGEFDPDNCEDSAWASVAHALHEHVGTQRLPEMCTSERALEKLREALAEVEEVHGTKKQDTNHG